VIAEGLQHYTMSSNVLAFFKVSAYFFLLTSAFALFNLL
jgi:hypothetical protein